MRSRHKAAIIVAVAIVTSEACSFCLVPKTLPSASFVQRPCIQEHAFATLFTERKRYSLHGLPSLHRAAAMKITESNKPNVAFVAEILGILGMHRQEQSSLLCWQGLLV